jgi:hypothetical protein
MRVAVLSSIGWLGALQSVRPPGIGLETTGRIVAAASVLGTLTVLIYRLGVWRQEMENTKHNVVREIDHLVAASSDHRVRISRWQARTNRRLDRLEAGGKS